MDQPRMHSPLIEPEEPQTGGTQPRITTFTSLRNRNFLWYCLASIAGFTGLQMGIIARGWLVWELTGSATQLGVVSFAFGVPVLLFSLFGGAVADRVHKRNLLVITQFTHASITLAVAILVATGAIQLWHMIVSAAATGVMFIFDGPTRMAMIPELVPRRQFLNAVSLNSTGVNLTRVVAPTVAGALLVVIGTAGVLFIVVTVYIIAACLLRMISLPRRDKVRFPGETPAGWPAQSHGIKAFSVILKDLWGGLKYLRQSPLILWLLALAFVPLVFGLPYQNLLPVVADEVLGVGEFGYGTLIAVTGLGALVSSLGLASMGDFRRKGPLLLILATLFGAMLIAFGLSHSYALSLAILAGVGLGGTGYMTLNNTLIQTHVPRQMLGRIMSIYMMTFALMPMGTLPVGVVADAIGVGAAIAAGGAIVFLFVLALAVLNPRLRRLE